MKKATSLIISALALSGCMVGPDYQRPRVDMPADYREGDVGEKGFSIPAQWWRLYGDATLDRLVDTALTRNTDVRLAVARIEEAEALLREAGAVQRPEIDIAGSATRGRSSSRAGVVGPLTGNNFQFGARTFFELDFWGRLRRLRDAARAQYIGTRYARDVVALTLAAETSKTYFGLRSLDAQIAVSQEMQKAAEESLSIVRDRAQAGFASDLELSQAAANSAQLAAQTKELQRLRALALHQLGVLTGQSGLALDAGDLGSLPTPPLPPAGLPANLLERRPDVREAESALVSATAEIGVTRASAFPTFSLTAALGAQSSELSTLFASGAGTWSLGLGVLGPVLDWGRYEARTEQAEARARQAAASYERAAQTAFREVADALSNVRLASEAEAHLRERVDQARNALRLANLRYRAGYSAYLEVLDAQRTLNEAQLALVRNREAFLGYTVDLMNALGGGWDPNARLEPRPREAAASAN